MTTVNELGYEVTDWVPVSTPPKFVGIYQLGRKDGNGVIPHLFSYSFWNGKEFAGIYISPDEYDGGTYVSHSLNAPDNFYRGAANEFTEVPHA
jgi:hypothetical protein